MCPLVRALRRDAGETMINNSAWISLTRNCLRGDGLSRMSIRANHCRRPRQLVSAPPKQRLEALAAFGATAADAILVHSDSRFFRDQFRLASFVRQLDKNDVRLVSITQDEQYDPPDHGAAGDCRRDPLHASAQRVEVDDREVRIMGRKTAWLRTLVASEGGEGICVPSFVRKWRAQGDSNPCFRRERATS